MSIGRERLADAGWDENAGAPEEFNLGSLSLAGYHVWQGAFDILFRLTGIVISFTRNGLPDRIWFDPASACTMVSRSWVASYETRVGALMLPIGFAYDEHLLLLLAEDGRVFGAFDDFLACLGDSEIAAIELLVTNGELSEFSNGGE